MSHMLQSRFLLDILLEPGNILTHKDIQISFKMTLGESAQNSPAQGPDSFFSQQVGMSSVPVCMSPVATPFPPLPARISITQAGKRGVQPDALHLCWEFLGGSSHA